jgi:hypothetical protein
VAPAAHRLGHRAVEEVGADGHHRLDANHEDEQRREQRAAADPRQADEDPHGQPEEDDQGIHAVQPMAGAGLTCRPHSVLAEPAQRPSRPLPGRVHGAQPIDA